jgi:predicted  nucleic acid-binding Zn-ribbon protein
MFTTALTELLVAQAGATSTTPGWALGVGILAVLAISLLGWTLGKTRSQGSQLAELQTKLSSLDEEHRKLGEVERKRAKDLEQKRDELGKLKKDLAGQKKKTHAAKEETKKLREDLTDQRAVFEKRHGERPAFESAPAAPVAKKIEETDKSEKRVEKTEAAPAVTGITLGELQQKVTRLEEANARLAADLDATRQERNADIAELKRLRRRAEDYRRIDVVTQGKMAAFEDRINHLGRQYYEACTEIAVLKGEVPRVPPPQEMPPPSSAPKAQRSQPAPSDDGGHEDSSDYDDEGSDYENDNDTSNAEARGTTDDPAGDAPAADERTPPAEPAQSAATAEGGDTESSEDNESPEVATA